MKPMQTQPLRFVRRGEIVTLPAVEPSRTLLDVLNAQNQTTQTRIALESAKQNYILSRMRLGALVQDLDMSAVSQMLK